MRAAAAHVTDSIHVTKPHRLSLAVRRANAAGMLSGLGGEGEPLPEGHFKSSSMAQASIQRHAQASVRKQ